MDVIARLRPKYLSVHLDNALFAVNSRRLSTRVERSTVVAVSMPFVPHQPFVIRIVYDSDIALGERDRFGHRKSSYPLIEAVRRLERLRLASA